MAQRPQGRRAKEVIPFRAPPELADWLEARTDIRAGVRRTDVVLWALELGRSYAEASKDYEERIQALLVRSGLTERALLTRILGAGVAALERELAKK